jgi:hypothetical protein
MLNTLGWLHIECDDVERGIEVTARAAAFAHEIRHANGVDPNERWKTELALARLHAATEG